MPKARFLKMPLMVLTSGETKERVDTARKRSGRRINAKTMGKPVLRKSAKAKGGGSLPTPLRRKRVVCRVLAPEEWNLIFPDIPSDYGGTVCFRR